MKLTGRMSLRVRRSNDEGMILVAVLGAMIVLSLFALATLAYALQATGPNRDDQDGKAALAAAQAGINDYLSRLNNDPSYYTQGNSDATNAAFTSGKSVSGTSGAGGTYTYKLLTDTGTTVSSGYIRLQSKGTMNGITRTLTARLSPSSFLQYIYHTDKEDLDPALYDSTDATVDTKCNQYYYAWGSNPGRSSYSTDPCKEIAFGSGDVINGPMHTNDAIQVGGTITFASPKTETSWNTTATNKWWGTGTPASASYKPVYAAMVTIPPSNAGLLTYANTAGVGCVYSGATRITFSSSGTMTVLSPNTAYSASCYPVGSDKSVAVSGITIPPVLYVQDYTGTCAKKSGNTITLGYPLSGEMTNTNSAYIGPDYACNQGTAYISGVLNGTTTLGSAQDIVAVGNVTYNDQTATSNDILGLIPTHFMWVYHPVTTGGTNMLSTPVTEIDAAILTVSDSFIVQNYNQGAAISSGSTNKLTILGAIAQNYRGTVATTSNGNIVTGYLKNYNYDTRYQHGAQPPYFLQPVSTTWTAGQTSDG